MIAICHFILATLHSYCVWPFMLFFLLSCYVTGLRRPREVLVVIKKRKVKPDPPYLSPLLFSVSLSDSFITSSYSPSVVFSSARIPIQWCPHDVQRSRKSFRKPRCLPIWRQLLRLLFLLSTSTLYALPGTNHALIS